MTTRLQRSPSNNSEYFASSTCRADWRAAPFVVAPFGRGSLVTVRADLNVMSTANWAPCWMGKQMARTSIALSSRARTEVFMSRSFTSRRTAAPTSRHTLANVRSVGSALVFKRPERGQAALRGPTRSSIEPREAQPLQEQSSENLGCASNSLFVGEPPNTSPAPGPERCRR